MARLARSAQRDIRELSAHYLRQHRPETAARLTASVAAALAAADDPRTRWRSAPTPYPELASLSFRWLKLHRYWFACTTAPDGEGIIHAILYDAANIPARLPRP